MPACLLSKCLICGKNYQGTLSEGLLIKGYYICRNCENKIVKISKNDDYYDYICDIFKKTIWKDLEK